MSITTLADLKTFMGRSENPAGGQAALDFCELYVAHYLGMDSLAETTRVEEITPARDRPSLEVANGAITTLTSVTYGDPAISISNSDLTIEKFLILRDENFNMGRKYTVTYKTGWTAITLAFNHYSAIKQAIFATAAHYLNGGGAGVSSQSVGDYSASFEAGEGSQAIPPVARVLLQPWRRPSI